MLLPMHWIPPDADQRLASAFPSVLALSATGEILTFG